MKCDPNDNLKTCGRAAPDPPTLRFQTNWQTRLWPLWPRPFPTPPECGLYACWQGRGPASAANRGRVSARPVYVSEHLRLLKEAGLINSRVEGARAKYCVNRAALKELKALVKAL